MSTKKTVEKKVPKDSSNDGAEAAHKAFDAVLPRMQAVAKKAVVQVNVDLQQASIRAGAVAAFLAEPEPRARFALLPAKVFDPSHLADLRPLALAAGHAFIMLQSARAQSTEAKLPVKLVGSSVALKDRMMTLSRYHFQNHPVLSREVQDIAVGTGYRDLASDLVRLAKVYEDNRADIEHDKLFYRAEDAAEARRLAGEITRELGLAQSAEEAKWIDLNARIWTLLRTCYDEIWEAGTFLYRHEDPDEKFPSLHSGGRPRKSKATPEAAAPPAGGTPA